MVHIGKMKIEHIVVHGSFDNSSHDGCVGVDKTFKPCTIEVIPKFSFIFQPFRLETQYCKVVDATFS